LQNFVSIENSLINETISYNCDCNDSGVFAYVFPNRPYNIWLCPAFRSANIDGTDSRAGTIIHELSHFQILADTDDHQYGQSATQQLARTNPALAIDNADSHEYFAENTPALAISTGTTIPDDPPTAQVLVLNQAVSGSVMQNQNILYSASGVERVELTTISGDADLEVYRDPELTRLVCSSDAPRTSLDACLVDTLDTVYIVVEGYQTSNYSVVAIGEMSNPPMPPDESDVIEIFALGLNSSEVGQVQNGRPLGYEVMGNSRVRVEPILGDANITVYSNRNITDDSLVCSSAEPGLNPDVCDIMGVGTYYVAVATEAPRAEYRISLTPLGQTPPDDDPDVIPLDPLAGGSSGGGANAPALLVLLAGLAMLRRRKGQI